MSINLTPGGRVSELMLSQRLMSALRRSQSELSRAQLQMTTGRQIESPREDPLLASRVMSLSSILRRLEQFKDSTAQADGLLSSADSALAEATDVLRQAHTLAISSVGATVSDAERSANAQLVNSLIGQMQRLANRDYLGRYFFDGRAGTGVPFGDLGGGIVYSGGRDPFCFPLDAGWNMDVALDGETVFGGESAKANEGGDLNPIATAATRVADLHGAVGSGVALGTVRVSDGLSAAATLDLSAAATVGDVIDLFNAGAPAGVVMSLDATGDRFRIVAGGGANLTIEEVAGGAGARDLGIVVSGGGSAVTGSDFDPKLTETTPVGLVLGGAGFDQTGISITNGTLGATISLAAAGTIQDVLNAINGAGVGARAFIGDSADGLVIVNTVSGTDLKVFENGGSTATDLSLRTFYTRTALSGLNGGQGVGRAGAGLADFRIHQRDGTTLDVEISAARTVGDVIWAINSAPDNTGDLVATLSLTGGIELNDSSPDLGQPLYVMPQNMSSSAEDLGLLQMGVGPTLVGDDVSTVQTGGVFCHLLRLRDAMTASDTAGISRYAALIESDMDQLIEIRGTVGAQAAQVQRQADKIDEEVLNNQTLLSQIQDLDLTEAILRFQQLQSQLTASMMAAGQLLNVSLLDFIR